MTSEAEINEEDLIRECANTPFESLVVLTLKELTRTVKKQGEEIALLKKGGK